MSTLTSRRLVGLAALLILTLAGCRSGVGTAGLDRAPVRPAQVPDSELLATLSDLGARAASYTARADLDYSRWDGSEHSIKLRLAVVRPDRLYMKGYKSLLPTLFTLVGNSEGLWLDVPTRKETYFAGPETEFDGFDPEATASGLAMSPRDYVRLLAPEPPGEHESWIASWSLAGAELLGYDSRTRRPSRRLQFGGDPLRLEQLSVYDDEGFETARASYSDYKEVAGKPFPHRVKLVRPAQGVAIEFSYEEVKLRELSPGLFAFEPPSGHEVKQFGTQEELPWDAESSETDTQPSDR